MVTEGTKVTINGKEYTLGSRLGGGLEGNIFNVEGLPNFVIKIINDDKMTRDQRNEVYNHLKWLKDLGSRNKEIRQCLAVPKGLLDDYLGYVMVKAGEHDNLKKYIDLDEDNFDEWYTKNYTFKKRYQIIIDLFDALRKVHLNGLIFTDLSPNNIMVHRSENQIVFIDTDNTRRRTDLYNGVLGTQGYMAPEVYRKPDIDLAMQNNIDPKILSNCGRLTTESDIFSAAVIAFQLLTLEHPFIGDEVIEGTAEEEERALEIKTDYIFKEGTTNTSTHGITTKFNEITTPEIRKLFYRTFVDGKEKPALRPTAEEFLEAFQKAYDQIITCPHCGFSRLYSYDDENICINCEQPLDTKVSIVIYNVFKDLNRAEAINSIGNYPQYDISIDNLRLTNSSKLPPNHFEISRVILEPGEKNAKYLYLRHFEKNTDRSLKYAKVTLNDSATAVKVEVLNNAFVSPFLVEKKSRQLIALNNGKEFPLDKYGIIFETKKLGKGAVQIFCKFTRE